MINWLAQELPSSCVAACVRMALGGLGEEVPESQVRRLIGHSALGVALAAAQAQLVQAGATAHLHDDWNLADLRDALRNGHFPIVGVARELLGYPRAFHALVLVRVTSAAVSALDPLDGPKARRYGTAAFTLAWELAGRETLLIESSPLRW